MSRQYQKFLRKIDKFNSKDINRYSILLEDLVRGTSAKQIVQIFKMKEFLKATVKKQKKLVRDSLFSLPLELVEKSFEIFEETKEKEKLSNKSLELSWRYSNIDEIKSILHDVKLKIKGLSKNELLKEAFLALIKYQQIDFPNYICNELLNSIFSLTLNHEKPNVKEEYHNKLLGIQHFKSAFKAFFNELDGEYMKEILLIGYILWKYFENQLDFDYHEKNKQYIIPDDEIAELNFEIFKSINDLLIHFFNINKLEFDVVKLKEIFDMINLKTKDYSIIIEPWAEYLIEGE